MKVICAACDCIHNGKNNKCDAKSIVLSDEYVMTVWQGRQHYHKCKMYQIDPEMKKLYEMLEIMDKGEA